MTDLIYYKRPYLDSIDLNDLNSEGKFQII